MIKSSLGLKVIVFRCILLTIDCDHIIFWHALLCERLLRQKSNKWQWIRRSDQMIHQHYSHHHYITSIKITELPLLTISSSQCMTLSTSLFSPIVTIKTLCQHFPSPTKNRFVQHILNSVSQHLSEILLYFRLCLCLCLIFSTQTICPTCP